jgi:hypothetical protein
MTKYCIQACKHSNAIYGLNFTAGYHWDDEIKDLENNVEIAKDMDTFISILKF